MMARAEWQLDAACAHVDPDLHFPPSETPAFAPQIAKAKEVCASCPVIGQCRQASINEPEGIWAGLTAGERREIRARDLRQRAELVQHERHTTIAMPQDAPTTPQAQRILAELIQLRQEAGHRSIRVADLPASFFDQVRSRGWARRELNRLAGIGELVELPDGVFAFPTAELETEEAA